MGQITLDINGNNARILVSVLQPYRGKEKIYIHQLHCPSLPRMLLFKDSVESLHKSMMVQDIEPTMGTIHCWYIKLKGGKLVQDALYLPM